MYWLKFCFIGLIIVSLIGCDNDRDCAERLNCLPVRPVNGDLLIKLTLNSENREVPITIYRGDYEDKNIFTEFIASDENTRVIVPLDTRLTVAAEYKQAGKKIIAIDHARVTTDWYDCSDCYEIEEGVVNVRIKNYFK